MGRLSTLAPLTAAAGLLAAACAASDAPLPPLPAAGGPARTIHAVSHGWHTGVVIRRADVPSGIWPEQADLAAYAYIEIAWGDRDFYQAPEATSGLALRAAFRSRESVLHMIGLDHPRQSAGPEGDSAEIRVPAEGLGRLAAFLEAAHARDAAGRAIRLGPGLAGPRSRFYLARERYSLLRTCNTWTARALEAAGCGPPPSAALTASAVMAQARLACPR